MDPGVPLTGARHLHLMSSSSSADSCPSWSGSTSGSYTWPSSAAALCDSLFAAPSASSPSSAGCDVSVLDLAETFAAAASLSADPAALPANWFSTALAAVGGLPDAPLNTALAADGRANSWPDRAGCSGDLTQLGFDSTPLDLSGFSSSFSMALMSGGPTSRHSSDSGNSSAASRDASLFGGSPVCSACDEPASTSTGPASAKYQCVECSDYLCYSCACAHRRVRLTRSHAVLPVGAPPSQRSTPPSNNGINNNMATRCPLHPQALLTMLCNTCQLPLCYTCALEHAEHSLDTLEGAAQLADQRACAVRLQAQQLLAALSEARQRAVGAGEAVRQRAAHAQLELTAVCDKLRAALSASQHRMERKTAAICQVKLGRLRDQCDQLDQLRGRVLQLLDEQLLYGSAPGDLTAGGASDADRLVRCLMADHQLRAWTAAAQLSPVEDAALRFVPAAGGGAAAVDAVVAAAGRVESAGCAAHSYIVESGCAAVIGRPYQAAIQVRDHFGDERVYAGGDVVQARVVTPDRCSHVCDVQHVSAGRYRLSYVPRQPGEHHFSVMVNGAPCTAPGGSGAPGSRPVGQWTRRAVSPRRLSSLGPVRLTIGGEGSEPGRFCRPWGVAFAADGRMAVSDRSNHRVQIFSADGQFLCSFGRLGQKPGELNRPAGVAFTSRGCLAVADKDNHRICLFSNDGRFVLQFGEKGSRLGMFNYPWDVACNGRDQIAVSDTRNHRVQLFSHDGVLLKKFSQEGADWKELDSPRGLTFHPDGRLYITDFNNHRIVALDLDTGKMTFLGREGTEPGRFLRPQGIAADEEGRLYVADCRNSRVQLLSPCGEFLMKLGEHGARPGQFDQPQGLAVGPRGQLAVVCLENHRVQLF